MSTVIGAPVLLTASFASAGAPIDPTTVSVTVTLPDGTNTGALSATRVTAGSYQYSYTTTQTGRHVYYFTGSGANAGILSPDVFYVHSLTTGMLVGLADVKAQLNKTSTGDDDELKRLIETASYAVNYLAGYSVSTQFTDYAEIGAPEPTSGYIPIKVPKAPLLSVTSVTPNFLAANPVSLNGMYVDQDAGIIWLPTTAAFLGPCTVVYTAGRSIVPQPLQSACLMIVAHLWETQQGGATSIPGMGGDETVMVPGLGYGIPVRALQIIEMSPYHPAAGFA